MCRSIVFACLLVKSLGAFSQPVSVDLSLSNNQIVSLTGGDVNANVLMAGQVVRIKVVIGNFVSGVAAPAGHFKLKIGLGNGLVVNPGFSLITAPLSSYFSWSEDLSGAQPQIVGRSIADLPDGFAQFADFEVKVIARTKSTVSFNLLISNPAGTATPVSDPAPANNNASNTYSIPVVVPVNFTQINAVKKDCDVFLTWSVANQARLKTYRVEAGKDNVSFATVGDVPAVNSNDYSFVFPLQEWLKSPALFIRIKSINLDDTYQYSKTIALNGECKFAWQLFLFPNPASEELSLTIAARQGAFNGKYELIVSGINGQRFQQTEVRLSNAKSFWLSVGNLAAGKYQIKISNVDGSQNSVLTFEKL